jgi:hypothetical protein
MSRTVVAPSVPRGTRKVNILCRTTDGELDLSHDTSLSLRADFGQEGLNPRTTLLAPFYPFSAGQEATGGVPGDLDATIAVDTCLQTQCSADAAALFI